MPEFMNKIEEKLSSERKHRWKEAEQRAQPNGSQNQSMLSNTLASTHPTTQQ